MWLLSYGRMASTQKQVTKLLWVIKSTVRLADEHRLARDIIRDMFESDGDFEKHVLVVFTFQDKAPIDNPSEWLTFLCKGKPYRAPNHILFGKESTKQDELMNQILKEPLTSC